MGDRVPIPVTVSPCYGTIEMSIFQQRTHALMGSACLEKADDLDWPGHKNVYVKTIQAYRQVDDWQSVQSGDYGIAIAGASGSAVTGESGAAWVGDLGTACAGMFGTAIAGTWGRASSGDGGAASALACGIATAGRHGVATVGDFGNASAGDFGAASAGSFGIASVGANGTASAGVGGSVCAGEQGEVRLDWWDEQAQRYHTVIGYIGKNGLEPNTHYKLNEQHVLVRACQLDQAGRLRYGQ